MKNLKFYEVNNIGKTEDEIFDYLISSIIPQNRTWDYFINWDKVRKGVEKFKIELSILNSLCNSKNFNEELLNILDKYPEVINVIPLLIGVRDNKIQILDSFKLPDFDFLYFDFSNQKSVKNQGQKYLDFFIKSGIKDLIIKGGITNLIDYSYGVEVGLDTNGRKNRGGSIMEGLVEKLLKEVYELSDDELLSQSNFNRVYEKWGIELPLDKSNRRPDFIIYKNKKIIWIETNFYSGTGSKLKSTCGEYKTLNKFLKNNNVEFVWITDGNGWLSTKDPLKETFIEIDYLFNLSMIKNRVLNEIL